MTLRPQSTDKTVETGHFRDEVFFVDFPKWGIINIVRRAFYSMLLLFGEGLMNFSCVVFARLNVGRDIVKL